MAQQTLTVRAKRDGIYGEKALRQDETFDLVRREDFSTWWMTPIGWSPDEVPRLQPKPTPKA